MSLGSWLSGLFAVDSLQFWWYLTRAAGLMGYFLIWLSTAWGLVVSSKILDGFIERTFTYDFHEYLAWLGLAFIGVHVIVLMVDRYLPYSVWQVLIPFLSPYRPLWVAIGIIAFYLTLLVTITFYIRTRISAEAFRRIHYLSVAAYLGATLHGLYAGTDSVLPIASLLYKGTLLITLFLMVYWVVLSYYRKREAEQLKMQRLRKRLRTKAKPRSTTALKNSR
ncbi:MAG TPA: ferric reductase-like transmembrane domain-containing protein [Anaerolineales bacterium]|nr:ferric reductase-like transmembrane domain-containing protein [Anaerolineales bacterium]